MPPLLLASGSPRRKSFLLELGFDFRVVRTAADETRLEGEDGETYVRRVARLKAAHAASPAPGSVVLAADTTVVAGDEVLAKPADETDFHRMMQLLSGRTHDVFSGVCVKVVGGESFETSVRTRVTFRTLSSAEINWYWATGEPQDKAGGYAVQGRAGAFITKLDGSHTNVVGLPLVETLELLEKAGVKPPWLDPRVRS